jgi:polysaccharide export outer membrane protein
MVTVVVAKASIFKVSILGKVRQAGRYEVDGGTTVLDVLAEAGGPNDYGDATGMYVLRRSADGQYERLSARFSSSVTPGKENTNVLLKPGDIIIVP